MLLPILALFGLANGDTFSTSNIQLMHGIDFDKVIGNQVDDKFSTLTYENFTAWEYGDNYFFADFTHATFKNDKKYEIYAELSPRFSISKISNQNLSVGILKDVYVAGTVEQGDGFQNRLGGLSVDLDLPYFSIFSITQTVRKDYFDEKKDMQTTLVWKMPLSIENFNFSFEGFVDKTSQDIIYQPQILLDMACIGMNKNKVFAGVEFYGYRHDDLDIAEFKPQLMIKAVW